MGKMSVYTVLILSILSAGHNVLTVHSFAFVSPAITSKHTTTTSPSSRRNVDGCKRASSTEQTISNEEKENLQRTPPQVGNLALLDAISNFVPDHTHTLDACRIFHGRGGLYPGADHLTLDYYPPVFLLTSFQELVEEELVVYGEALKKLWGNTTNDTEAITQPSFTWVYQTRAERGNTETRLMSGEIPDPHIVTESNGREKYLVNLQRNQNHGLFLDMAAGRTWLQNKCLEGEVYSVLNLFAYTCAFSVVALKGGADRVVNVDMSHGALKIGQRNHELNGLTESGGAKFLSHDVFKTWGKIKKLGPYDAVVIDPPSYQKGSFVASKDYIKVIRRLPSLLHPDGYAVLSLNAPELSTEWLLDRVKEADIPDVHFVERLENPKTFASAFPERALKVLIFQYRPEYDEEEDSVE